MTVADDSEKNPVRSVVGANIARIRNLRGMTVRDLSSALAGLGLKLSASGVSEVENAGRKLPVEELLIFAIALNTSVVDLLIPDDGRDLDVATGVEPFPPGKLEGWVQGKRPWRLMPYGTPSDARVTEEFREAAARPRQEKWTIDRRPEIAAIERLKAHVREVARAQNNPAGYSESGQFTPEVMAELLRKSVGNVDEYIELLASTIEREGYGGR